jgi:ribosomal protein S9
MINQKTLQEYFPLYSTREMVLQPFLVTETLGKFDAICSVGNCFNELILSKNII